MNWQQSIASILIGWGIVTGLLFLGWIRHSLETSLTRRVAELYLWLFTIPLMLVGVAYARLGLIGLGVSGGLHLTLTAAAVAVLGRSLGSTLPVIRLASALLAIGSATVLVGAITWPGGGLSSIAARPDAHTTTAVLFLAGSLVTLAGYVGLRTLLRAAGDEWLSGLGLVSLQLGTALWTIHLVFRITVVRPVAENSATTPPPWFEPLHTWSGGLYAIYMVLAYLAIAAFGGALLKARWVSPGWGRTLVGFGVLAAGLFVSLAGGPFSPPLIVQLPGYAMGILVMRKLIIDARQQRVAAWPAPVSPVYDAGG